MKLTKFKLVNTDGRTGVFYKGRTIPFEKIDDKLAEELVGKTDVLEPLPDAPADDKKKELPAAG